MEISFCPNTKETMLSCPSAGILYLRACSKEPEKLVSKFAQRLVSGGTGFEKSTDRFRSKCLVEQTVGARSKSRVCVLEA